MPLKTERERERERESSRITRVDEEKWIEISGFLFFKTTNIQEHHFPLPHPVKKKRGN